MSINVKRKYISKLINSRWFYFEGSYLVYLLFIKWCSKERSTLLDIVERRNSFQDIPLKINPIVGASRWTDTYKSFSKYRNSLAIETSYKKANIIRYRLSLDKIQNGNTGNGSVLTLPRLINAIRRLLDVLKLVANFKGDKTKIKSV